MMVIGSVTTVDSGSKALEFLGLLQDEQANSPSPSPSSPPPPEQNVRIKYSILMIYLFTIEFWMVVWIGDGLVCQWSQEIEVNLVITDYCMPGMTGYDLLKKIKVPFFSFIFFSFFPLFWEIIIVIFGPFLIEKATHLIWLFWLIIIFPRDLWRWFDN